MKRLIIAAAIALSACGGIGQKVQSASVTVSTVNLALAKGEIAINDLYTAASKAGQALVKQGLWDKSSFKAADLKAYNAAVAVSRGQITADTFAKTLNTLSGGK